MPDKTFVSWPGPLFSETRLPYSNALTAGISGDAATLRGTDPAPYAQDVAGQWMGVGEKDAGAMATDPAVTPATPAGFSLLHPLDSLKRAGVLVAGVLIGGALVVLGAYTFTRGGQS